MRANLIGTRHAASLLVTAVLLSACARTPEPQPPMPEAPAVPDAAAEVDADLPRTPATEIPFLSYAVEPVPVSPSFNVAVERGTRTLEGRPGPDYWQQYVEYRIDVQLDPETAILSGEEVITYYNRSPDTLPIIVFNIYQNLFKQGQPRVREVPITGGMVLERVAVAGTRAERVEGRRAARQVSGPAYVVDGTVMVLRLPEPLAPGETTRLEIAWHFKVPPRGAPRMGRIGHELFALAQWYPQIATYDDISGWETWPYLGDGEFYLEYGEFDVSVTVPEGWLVAATGTLQNPEEVLTDVVRDRLEQARRTGEVVRVVTESDLGAGTATRRAPGGWLTWQFHAEDVRDFAFSTSNRYLWDATTATIPTVGGGERTIPVYTFYTPEAEAWAESARYTRRAVQFHSRRWYPYVYPQVTSAQAPVGGMEYPMLLFVSAFEEPQLLYSVIDHEVAHEWWPMMVGTKEAEYAWNDEGLVSYAENRSVMAFYEDAHPFRQGMRSYLRIAGTDYEKPMMRHADLYGPGPARVVASYRKPALMLRALSDIIGQETLRRALHAYVDRWLYKHPYPLDFFNTVEDVAGRDLDWFWYPWWFETAVLDQAITEVERMGGGRVAVTVAAQGAAPMPIQLVLTTEAGETRRVVVPVEVWREGARAYTGTFELPGPVARVAIDPNFTFPDVDRSDNFWPAPPTNGSPAGM